MKGHRAQLEETSRRHGHAGVQCTDRAIGDMQTALSCRSTVHSWSYKRHPYGTVMQEYSAQLELQETSRRYGHAGVQCTARAIGDIQTFMQKHSAQLEETSRRSCRDTVHSKRRHPDGYSGAQCTARGDIQTVMQAHSAQLEETSRRSCRGTSRRLRHTVTCHRLAALSRINFIRRIQRILNKYSSPFSKERKKVTSPNT